ncbi:MAG: VWA domain-containing protein [Archangiaceae bacterium]|nr:VWA domain-containing protein [Archangiaceae bacterium]
MRMMKLSLAALAVVVAGCDCNGINVNRDGGGGNGTGGNGSVGGGTGGSGNGQGGSGGFAGAGGGVMVDPNDLDNDKKDSDCDGLSDAEEFGNIYPGGARTDPANPDTDGDGLKDGVEAGKASSVDLTCGYLGDADLNTRTNPTNPDSDGDGIPDGVEDKNHNGRVDAGETDASNPDSDFDGLADGSEDANHNGVVDPGETDPTRRDTDGDFINDGVEKTTTHTDPTKADSDSDTCVDGNEDFNQNGAVDTGETNPNLATDCGPAVNPDSDNDGLPNRFEDRDMDGVVDPGETDPNNPDTDGDGLKDGIEDANKNGVVDVGETNPLRKDSDCDGLIDGPDTATYLGEDQNADGTVQATETDPRRKDTDGDGITDGVERGLTAAKIPDAANCPNVPVDLDPMSTTDPTRRDSDGDGIDDGAEDTNQNGRVDTGELDPKNGTDGTGPAGQVCTAMNLRPVTFKAEGTPDVQLGLPASFTEVATMTVGGTSRGLIGYDPTSKVAFVAWRQNAAGATATADEAALNPQLAAIGALSNPTTQTFTSWDGVGALQAFYNMAGAVDVKNRANAIAQALVGSGAGALMGAGGTNGPFQLQVEYLHRVNTTTMAAYTVVVLAMRPTSVTAEGAIFTMSDTAGGSAVAQFGDANAIQCETFKPSSGKVDFLFVVDDSCSMAASQAALGNTASAVATALNNSTLDWRAALVTSSYHLSSGGGPNQAVMRGFTTDIATVQAWLTVSSSCNLVTQPCGAGSACRGTTNGWVGICGSGDEGLLGAARKAVDDLSPAPADAGVATGKLRSDAQPVVILLGDADDQTTAYQTTSKCTQPNPETCEAINDFVQYFMASGTTSLTKNPTAKKIPVHGIVCPSGADTNNNANGIQTCNGEDQSRNQRHAQVITATGGIRGAINDNTSIATSTSQIISSTIGAAGYRMQKPPIGASVKVAMSDVQNVSCNKNDIPRSRTDGFDFDGVNRTLSFFGACRPGTGMVSAAVSYRYWVDTTPNPGGNPPPCSMDTTYYDPTDPDFCRGKLACNLMTNLCECPANCGGTPPAGKVCNPNRAVCDFVCTSDCGGSCNGFQQCNVTDCSCECVQSATCAPGYRFQNGAGVCGCVCDAAQLGCGPTYTADPATCSCVCKPGCGGCGAGLVCNPSTCSCGIGSPG